MQGYVKKNISLHIFLYLFIFPYESFIFGENIVDRIKNPFNPGAGSKPPALVGRNQIIEEATIQIK